MNFEIVVAFGRDSQIIEQKGDLPWRMQSDFKRFKRITTTGMRNAVIMGRKTWESLPNGSLQERQNVVLSRNHELELPPGVWLANDFTEALKLVCDHDTYVIGGGQVYAEALGNPGLTAIHQTIVDYGPDPLALMVAWSGPPKGHWLVTEVEEGIDNGLRYRYEKLVPGSRRSA